MFLVFEITHTLGPEWLGRVFPHTVVVIQIDELPHQILMLVVNTPRRNVLTEPELVIRLAATDLAIENDGSYVRVRKEVSNDVPNVAPRVVNHRGRSSSPTLLDLGIPFKHRTSDHKDVSLGIQGDPGQLAHRDPHTPTFISQSYEEGKTMAKIPLAIDKNYCASWKVFEGIRELLQNAKDADEDGHHMDISHFPRTGRLEITTRNIYVDPSKLLILGKSDKTPGMKRGQFGEGFVLGVLALMRQGFDVKFQNGDMSWSVSFEHPDVGHPFEGNELLTFKSRKVTPTPDFTVEIDGITTEIWAALQKLFLFLEPPKGKDVLEMTEGTLLMAPEHKGKVFSRGIFVHAFEDLACGYDMNNLQLDRDRRMIDTWDLHWKLGHLWQEACRNKPELAAPRVYDMAKADAAEVRQMHYHADAKLLKSVRDRFDEEHGPDAAPVSTMAAARAVEGVGAKPVVVSNTLKELLQKGGLTAESVTSRLEGTVEARFSPWEITGEENEMLARLDTLLPAFAVVTFRGDKLACRLIDNDTVVGVERRLLTGKFKALLTSAVNVEAKRRGIPALDVLLEHMAREAEPPQAAIAGVDFEVCDECGKAIPGATPSLMDAHHHHSCSLHQATSAPSKAES